MEVMAMAGIHVLSEILKVGSNVEKASKSKGKDVSDSPENMAAVFAAMMKGFANSNGDVKGQNSKVGQESDDEQSTGNPVPNVQNLNEQGSMPGYGNYALINLIQPMLQSSLPAGKGANSGNDVSQGTGGLAIAKGALLNLVSLISDEVSAQSGMTTPRPQGGNPGMTELDKYRQVIANLLVALSGEITEVSPKVNLAGSDIVKTKDFGQEMTKPIGPKGIQPLLDALNKGLGTGNPEFTAKVASLLETLKIPQVMSELIEVNRGSVASEAKGSPESLIQASIGPKGIQPLLDALNKVLGTGSPELTAKVVALIEMLKAPQVMNELIEVKVVSLAPESKGSSESGPKSMTGTNIGTPAKDTAPVVAVQQNQQKLDVTTSSNILQRNSSDEAQGDRKPTEASGIKDIKKEYSNVGIGAASNLGAVNIADGKTVVVPVWEQISAAIRLQATNRHQELKELEIKLHPADLGTI